VGYEKRPRRPCLWAGRRGQPFCDTIPPPHHGVMGLPVTPLLGTVFGVPGSLVAGRQAKIWFPGEFNAANLSVAIASRARQSWGTVGPSPPQDFGLPDVPVAPQPDPVVLREEEGIRPVLPRPVGIGSAAVPRAVVEVEGVSTEVEEYEGGDFPAGSIFAPGRAWGQPAEQHDLDASIEDQEEDEPMAHDWGHLTRQAIGGLFGVDEPTGFNALGPAFAASGTTIPSGSAALPPSAAPVISGTGDGCGNRRYVTLDRTTGKISCKRRRRRRLLTNRDLADLASLKTITGGGAALNAAVIRAVR